MDKEDKKIELLKEILTLTSQRWSLKSKEYKRKFKK
jgi:hypothetical protein